MPSSEHFMPSDRFMSLSIAELEDVTEDIAVPNESRRSCNSIFKANMIEMLISSSGTAIWMLLYYMHAELLGGELAAYLIKTPLMGLVPNMLGCGLGYYAERIRSEHIRNVHVLNRHARHYAKENFYIYAIIDFVYQPLIDSIHSMLSGSWEMFADSTFEWQEILLNVVFTLFGISLLHYYLTKWIRGQAFASWVDSGLIGPQYFCFYGVDYPLDIMSARYDLSDEMVDYVGSTIGTGVGTFVINVLYDAVVYCRVPKQRVINDKTSLLMFGAGSSTQYGSDMDEKALAVTSGKFKIDKSKVGELKPARFKSTESQSAKLMSVKPELANLESVSITSDKLTSDKFVSVDLASGEQASGRFMSIGLTSGELTSGGYSLFESKPAGSRRYARQSDLKKALLHFKPKESLGGSPSVNQGSNASQSASVNQDISVVSSYNPFAV